MSNSVTRLSLVSHASTLALRRARFAADEPIDEPGFRNLARTVVTTAADTVLVAPELRTRQTAVGLELSGEIHDELHDVAYGAWSGSTMDDLAEPDLLAWLTDTSTTPPNGESIDDVLRRVGGWMASTSDRGEHAIAITHPAVIRAAIVRALDAPSNAFWRIDIPPLTSTTLHHRAGRWTLRSVAEKII